MRVPLSWLRDYVAVDLPPEELADRLSVSSAEAQGVHRLGPPDVDGNLGLFRVGRVVEAGKHPNADRLQLCRVDVGEGEPRQIVCGAWNFGAGATVAVALPGARLPGADEPLREAKLRGETSHGMILSERELELGGDHTGIMVLEEELEPGTPLVDALPLTEVVLDFEITGNRPDLLSVYGMAREVATLLRTELAAPPGREPERAADEPVDVAIEDYEGCPRYIGRLFRDVRIGPSPAWLRARLTASGLRPISNVVDVTNYVMHGLGNPLHVFDFDALGGGRIVVRRARRGEKLRTLDGMDRTLEADDLVIADAENAVALAGIMGGEETEVTGSTGNVLLEAANFEPTALWRTSERLRLRTEGSNRWEKGVDPHLAGTAATWATELIVSLAGARWVGASDVFERLPERPVIRFRPAAADTLIGLDVAEERQQELLDRLGFDRSDGEVVAPTWRARDVTREVDLTEEVARFELDRVPFTLPLRRHSTGLLTREQRIQRRIEDVLAGLGLSEVYTPSLVAEDADPRALRLPEPISIELAVLRTSLLPSLVETARHNLELGNEQIGLWEIARVYLPEERIHVGCVLEGDFFRAKGIVEAVHTALKAEARFEPAEHSLLHPGKAARVPAGVLGELHPSVLEGRWAAWELDLHVLAEAAQEPAAYRDVVSFPAVKQDLAFVVDEEVRAGDLVEAVREAGGAEVRDVRVFDVYHGEQAGEGKKSVALHVAFQSPERTLSDEDAAALRERIVAELSSRFAAVLRA